MLNLNQYPNADTVVIRLLKELGIHVKPQDVADELEKHPDYPSLLAISDVLDWFKVDNAAYRIGTSELADVPVPFIAHTNKNDDFVLVSKLTTDKVTFSDHKQSGHTLSLDEFRKRFKGVVLTAERPTDRTVDFRQSWTDLLAPYKIPAALLTLLGCFAFTLAFQSSYFTNLSWQIAALGIFKTAGLITSLLLLAQSIDKNNPLVQTLCGGGAKTDCNAILTSKQATVFKGLSWSEVGFFYFAGTWLALLFGSGGIAVTRGLAVLNLISLPYTIYSINYQARIAKQWCVLCTTVQALLWLEFIALATLWKQPYNNLTVAQWSNLLVCLALPVGIWLILKPLFLNAQKLRSLKQQLHKTKYNTELFYSTLKEQPKYALPHEDWSIVLGNVEANTIITMVSNPYCPPCSKTHQILDDWLNHGKDLQLRIVFTANNTNEDIKTPVTRHLMALNELPDKTLVKNALHDWYEQKQKNYESWAKVYPVNLDETRFTVLEKQRDWCNLAEVKATPTLLINGYRLPGAYQLHDIKYMLE